MIPTHDLENRLIQPIKLIELGQRSKYDTTLPHRHDYFELFLFEKGEGVHHIDFNSFLIKSYAIHIVAPGQVHQVQRALDTNGYVFLFDMSVFEKASVVAQFLFDHICFGVDELSPVYEFDTQSGQQIIGMTDLLKNKEDISQILLLSHLNLICAHCAHQLSKSNPLKSGNNKMYHQFRRLLNANFKSQKKVKEYAEALMISEKQLNEIVSKKTGLSCSHLIYKQIVLEAKRLLNQGKSSKEVAYELCFDDPAHFSKFFKNQSGISPSEFQKVQA